MAFVSGFNATIKINGVEVPIQNFTVKDMAEKTEAKNSQSGARPIPVYTYKNATISFTLDFNTAASPYSNAPNIAAGAQLVQFVGYLNQSARGSFDGPQITATNLGIDEEQLNAQVKNNAIVGGTVTGVLYGTVTVP